MTATQCIPIFYYNTYLAWVFWACVLGLLICKFVKR